MFDHIVIGAGVEGSATAYQLSKRGKSVLLLEQFSLPHTRGSSHGASRITRLAYKDSFYTKMMVHAFKEWEVLEKSSGIQLYIQNGMLAIWPDGYQQYHDYLSSLKDNNLPYALINGAELNLRYSGRFRFPSDWKGLFDPTARILKADKALVAYWAEIKRNGGCIEDERKVVDIKPDLNNVTVFTDTKNYVAKSVVICAGPWTKEMTSRLGLNLPLRTELIKVCFWKEKSGKNFSLSGEMPCFYAQDEYRNCYFGMPSHESSGLFKFCLHHGEQIDPEKRDLKNGQWSVDRATQYVRKYFAGLQETPVIIDNCIYTITPDANFILDRHPQFNNVVIGAGFSGHGFKLSPVVGNILADLATGSKPQFDTKPFEISRFGSHLISNL